MSSGNTFEIENRFKSVDGIYRWHLNRAKPIQNENGEIEVEVHQSAKDMKGNVLFDGMVKHIYTLKNGLIKSMEIKEG